VPRILDLYRRGRLQLDELAGERFPLTQVDAAFAASREASGGRPVIVLAGDGDSWPA
jgi:Zn-dependent alcohol dehydrogenase